MPGETDLKRLLGGLYPHLDPQTYVFACVEQGYPTDALDPLMVFQELEGVTVILPQASADAKGLDHDFTCRRITLTVHSSLNAVGLIAAVATALKDAGIPSNTVAGYYHDHIFVPADRAENALDVLKRLSGG